MATLITTTHVCDRCRSESVGQVGRDFSGGYLSFGPINGANSDHVGISKNPDKSHADICEDCRKSLMKWWLSDVR